MADCTNGNGTWFGALEDELTPSADHNSDGANSSSSFVPLNDVTEELIAQAFEAKWGRDLRYDHDRARWYKWSEEKGFWEISLTNLVLELVRAECREAGLTTSRRMGRASAYSGIEKICRSSPAFAVTSNIWDQDPDLLGVPGAVINLRTGEQRQPLREDYITKQTAVAPDRTTSAGKFFEFLKEITFQDEGLQLFLQRLAGYALTGRTQEQKLFFGYGPGKNGKSVFLNTLTAIMKDYASVAPMETFTRKHFESHPTDLAGLSGARLVSSSETEAGRYWNETLIKRLTGGEPVAARFMRQDFFTYLPKYKLFFLGNHAPLLSNAGESTRRRILIIPFTYIPPEPDPKLEAKLALEWPAILAWAIEGARGWYAEGLTPPDVVLAETEEYFRGQDHLQDWMDECCLVGPNNFSLSSVLFNSWSKWAKPRGLLEEIPSNKRFHGVLRDRRLVRTEHENSGTMMYGLAVKVEAEADARSGERNED